MSDEIHRTEPVYTERANGHVIAVHHANANAVTERVRFATEYKDGDTSEHAQLNIWLRDNLFDERRYMVKAVAHVIADLDEKIEKLERTVTRLEGAVDVLRTGKVLRPCGLYNAERQYQQLDVVCLNGSSFMATADRPGPCPSSGDWQLLASAGSRGRPGHRGERGEKGEPGLSASPAASIRGLHIDPKTYTLSILAGRKLHQLNLRSLFQHFFNEALRSLR